METNFISGRFQNAVISFDFWRLSLQEQELYQKEGLGVNEVRYVDNQDCIGKSLHQFPSSHPVDPQTHISKVHKISQKMSQMSKNIYIQQNSKKK